MANSDKTSNSSEHEKIPLWRNKSFWHITGLMVACSVFYYMDVIINLGGWVNLHWKIFYTVHDLHRALFLIPVMYATYEFRMKGIIITSFLSLLVFLPRALVVSPYPDPLLRALIFMVSMVIMGVLLSKLLNNISERKKLEQGLGQAQNDLQRKLMEEALCESEDKYKRLLDNISDIIFTLDLEGRITFASRRTKEILGYDNAETINMNILSFIPEEDHQRALETLQKGMTGEKIKHFQIPMIAKSGERLIFECSFSRVYKDGAVIGAQGTAVDITERKRAEEERFSTLARFSGFADASQYGMGMADLDGRITFVNDTLTHLLGEKTAEDCLGKHFPTAYYKPSMTKKLQEEIMPTLMDVGHWSGELELQTADGRSVPTEENYFVVRDKQGRICNIADILTDITERKRAEALLQLKNLVFDTSIAAKSIADIDGIINEANNSFLQLWGYSSDDEVVGNPISYFLNDPDEAVAIVNTLNDKGKWRGEFTAKKKDGSTFTAYTMATSIRDANGKVTGYQSSVIDISERKHFDKLMSMQSDVLKVLISDITTTQTVENIVDIIKKSTGHDAVGLRLKTGNDYPFVASLGYSEEFLKAENTLTYNYPDGGLCRNADGTVSLECTCGMIISGKSDPDNPLSSPGGSVWTNNSLAFLDVPPEADPRLHPRNRCIHVGFLSLALIPIRSDSEVIGLLHLANRHQDSFSPAAIHFYEGIGISIGVALSRKRAKEEIIRLNTELEQKVQERTAELHKIITEIEETNRVFVGRELRMAELKERIAELEKKT
ncbi:MAG: PAS domain S-box protein [Deltaproteobacteria bacterium]|nr:PAS domain S-box protein [Deltaproteobacteria bacterium]